MVSGRGVAISGGRSYDLQGDVILWVRTGEEHQIRNTGAETLKLATVFVPAYTAEANYKRCLEAARAITQASDKF